MLILVAVGFCATTTLWSGDNTRQSSHIVSQVDHVMIVSNRAKELFALLKETLQLPVAWPMTSYGGFASGGVAVGNMNLEVVESAESAAGAASARYAGFALEPEPLRTSVPELDARGIRHGAPQPFGSRQLFGSTKTLWTTVALPTVSSENVEVFLCEYGPTLSARRDQLREQLQSRGGGPLSVQSVQGMVYGTRDSKQIEAQWQKILNPLKPSSQGSWRIGSGPELRMVQADHDEIQGLVVNVKSLDQARRFLKEQALLGRNQSDLLTLGGSLLEGLNISIVEQRSGGL